MTKTEGKMLSHSVAAFVLTILGLWCIHWPTAATVGGISIVIVAAWVLDNYI